MNYQSKLKTAFDVFAQEWSEQVAFWRLANTFDTATTLVMTAKGKWPNDPDVRDIEQKYQDMHSTYFKVFRDNKPATNSTDWADDYGWWGFSAMRAYRYWTELSHDPQAVAKQRNLAQTNAETFLSIAKQGYQAMITKGVLSNCSGCRNSPGGDAKTKRNGTANTVTNMNLFLLSAWLYEADGETEYLNRAQQQYDWFHDFVELTNSADQHADSAPYQYLQHTNDEQYQLVTERPMIPESATICPGQPYNSHGQPGWEPGWTWTGDQGLTLASLSTFLGMVDKIRGIDHAATKAQIQTYINTICSSAKALLFDHYGVLQEPPFYSSYRGDPDDYITGRGVFLRMLLSAEWGGIDFTENIIKTAEAVWYSKNKDNQFDRNWRSSTPDHQAELENHAKRFVNRYGYGEPQIYQWKQGPPKVVVQAAGLDALTAGILQFN